MGVIISSAVAPAAMTLIWKDQVSLCFLFTLSIYIANTF
jgi:hypothetical protein